MLFSITDTKTEADELIRNFLLQNVFFQKFLKTAIEQLDINFSDKNILNPIKILLNSTNKI